MEETRRKTAAMAYSLLKNSPVKSSGKVVIFDLDDTLIDSDTRMIIEPVYELFQWCLGGRYIPVIVTARVDTNYNQSYTMNELRRNNIHPHSIFFRKSENYEPGYVKTETRRLINERIGPVVMSIGDQPHDIGQYGGVGILLPSKF